MSLIEGIGDEVLQFGVVVFLVLVILLAWWSTGYSTNNERFRTVVIMERNVRRLYSLMPRIAGNVHQNGVTVYHWTTNPIQPAQDAVASTEPSTSNADGNSLPEEVQPPDDVQTDTESVTDLAPDLMDSEMEQANDTTPETTPPSPLSSQEIEMDRIVNAMESVACTLRNRRLAFFENQTTQNAETKPSEENSTDSAGTSTQVEDDKEAKLEGPKESSENIETTNSEVQDNIRIRLKYLNDDQKLVEGSLREPLGEFKRRHFRGEMSARKLVRLIFNGQVLQREAATLASCGLFDNCVVHCLIHQPRTPGQHAQVQQQLNPQAVSSEGTAGSNPNQSSPHIHTQSHPGIGTRPPEGADRDERDWDLSQILITTLAVILSIAWYCHIRYSNLFGVAASVAMFGLTALYFFSVVCVYYPDTANYERQSSPANYEEQTNTAN